MNNITRPTDIKDYFLKTNQMLTLGLILILVLVSGIFWYTNTVTIENSSLWIGAAFMMLALIFYKLPYISYLWTRRHFNQEELSRPEILGYNWSQFKSWLDS